MHYNDCLNYATGKNNCSNPCPPYTNINNSPNLAKLLKIATVKYKKTREKQNIRQTLDEMN